MNRCPGSLTVALRQDIVGQTGQCAMCAGTFRDLYRRGDDKLVPIHEPVISDIAIGYLKMARQRKG